MRSWWAQEFHTTLQVYFWCDSRTSVWEYPVANWREEVEPCLCHASLRFQVDFHLKLGGLQNPHRVCSTIIFFPLEALKKRKNWEWHSRYLLCTPTWTLSSPPQCLSCNWTQTSEMFVSKTMPQKCYWRGFNNNLGYSSYAFRMQVYYTGPGQHSW